MEIRCKQEPGMKSNKAKTKTAYTHNNWWNDLTFKFFRIPKVLIEDQGYKTLSVDAALLYGLLLDRAYLSEQSPAFHDPNEGIYVVYTIHEICKKMRCAHDKASKLLRELEKHQLVKVKRNRKNKRANQIYVLPFRTTDTKQPSPKASDFPTIKTIEYAEKQTSNTRKTSTDIVGKSDTSDTDTNDTEYNKTLCLGDVMSEEELRNSIKKWISYDCLTTENKYLPYLDTVLEIMEEVFSSHRKTYQIGKSTIAIRDVLSRFCQIKQRHIVLILETLLGMEKPITNLYGYLLAQLYYAPINIHHLSSDDILYRAAQKESDQEVIDDE